MFGGKRKNAYLCIADKKKRMEEKQRDLEEIHRMRMSGMTMEEIFA